MTHLKMPGRMLAPLLAICALTFSLAGIVVAADKPKSGSDSSGYGLHPCLRKTLLVCTRLNVRLAMARTERAIAPWEKKWGCEILPRPKYRK